MDSAQQKVLFSVLGAITPMQARKTGTLLFTTAISAQKYINMTANFGIAADAQLNYVRLLHNNLKAENVFAGIVSIAGLVVPEGKAGE